MTTEIRADFFIVEQDNGSMDNLIESLNRWNKGFKADYLELTSGSYQYRMSKIVWSESHCRLSGVMYKKRPTNLPDELDDNGEHTVDIGNNSSIGDPVCFCYFPKRKRAIVQFSQSGARLATLRKFLNTELGLSEPFHTSPMLNPGTAERLKDINVIRSIDISLRNPRQLGNIKQELGSSLGAQIDAFMDEFGGVNVSLAVTMGSDRSGRMKTGPVRKLLKKLTSKDVCTKLQLKGKAGVDDQIENIDLLNDTIKEYIEVADSEDGRSIDTKKCISQLHALFMAKMGDAN